MSLKKQKQKIIQDFIKLDTKDFSAEIIEYILLPYLGVIAKELGLNTVYVWASPYKNQLATLQLQHVQNPSETKRVLYAFASEQDAKRHPHFERTSHRIDKLPILDFLVQFLTSSSIDLAVFYPQKGKMRNSRELERRVVEETFEKLCREIAKENAESTDSVAKTAPFGLA
jgi:hypothetical protein